MFVFSMQALNPDEEDSATFDIPIFTEEFLDHNKGKLFINMFGCYFSKFLWIDILTIISIYEITSMT